MSIGQLERLYEIIRGLPTAKEAEPYLQSILSAATELTDSETSSIMEYDEAAEELRFAVVPWFHRAAIQGVKVPMDGSAAGWVIQHGEPLIIPDVKSESRHFRAIDRISNFQTCSILAVPLTIQGKAVGVFEVLNKANSADYTEEDVVILETLASLAALVMRNNVLELRLQDSQQRLVELDRLKSDFVAITSHELRTPLGLILGHATFLRELIPAEYHEQLDAIIRNASRLKEIIESLSNVDNYQTGAARIRQRKVSMARVVQDVVASFEEVAHQKGIAMKVDIRGGELLVEADGNKIAVALSNLIKNAIMFTDKDGHVFVAAEPMPGYVKVSVIDDGLGIPARDLSHVFERFFQVESHLTRRHGGMGLGLSVAKAMIEMHGGRIWAESVEGKGSNFSFLLPLDPQQAEAAGQVFSP